MERLSEIREALERGISSNRTCLVDIRTNAKENITPMTLSDPKAPIVMGRRSY